MSMTDSNKELVQSLYSSFARGDVPAVVGIMHPEIAWAEAEGNPYQPTGAPWIGPDAIVQNLFVKLASEWDGFTVHPVSYHPSGDAVVVEGRYRGTFKATGSVIDAQFCHVWRIRDARIANFQQFTDTAQFQDAMGAH